MAKLFSNQKLFHFFCQNVPSSIHSIYGILYALYGSECRFSTLYGSECREEKKRQNMAKWGGHQNSKNSKFRYSNLNIEKEFYYTVKDFFA